MPGKGVKILRDIVPWMNNVGKTLDDLPRTPYDRFGFLTGVKPVLYETDKLREEKEYDDRAVLQDMIQRLKDEGSITPPRKTLSLEDLKAMLGGRQ